MRRRSLLRRIAGVTALLIGSTLPYGFISLLAPNQAWPRRNHLRPPGALPNDDAFVSACIGCGLCGEVCPPRCIKFHSRDGGEGGEGGEGGGMGRTEINTPYIDPSVRACSLCGKCMEVCPTAALSPTLRKKVAMGIAQIDRTACYPWVDRGVCGACVTICP
ncbi:MAG: 4Fe-4S dicluster domain-containing protein, partial [Rhodospirillaceae bacterium]|nr:4Fe-4S dicluster domain-containing protein [Rhodospirillaceae bacterium]